jgi:flagellar hook-associated protein 2
MSTTSSISSLLNSLNPSNESLAELLGESTTSNSTTNNSSTDSAILDAVDAILNSATSTSGSGIDVTSTVDAILELDAEPEENLQNQVTALNSQTSALQTIETDLTNLQTAVQALSDPTGTLGDVTVDSSNNNVVSATAANGTAAGSYTVVVNSLATTSAAYSTLSTTATAALPTGTLTIQTGSNTLTVPVDTNSGDPDTLSTLASYINKQNAGVTASVITEGSEAVLSLVSQTSGSAGKMQITDSTGGSDGLGIQMVQNSQGQNLGTDASLTVDGVPVTSGSNTVTGVIPGMTLTLSGISSDPVTLDVQPDLTQASTGINNFVSAWNQLMSDINAQNTYSGSGSAPPLMGDPSLDLIQSQLLNDITTSVSGNGAAVNLQSIGIQLQEDGTLSVASTSSPDSMDLNDALSNDFSAVQNLFQSTSPAGVAQTLSTDLTNLTDPVNGPLNLDMSSISSQVSSLNDQISEFQYQLQQTQTQLTSEYSTINTTLEQMPELINQVNQQLNSLNPPGTSTT